MPRIWLHDNIAVQEAGHHLQSRRCAFRLGRRVPDRSALHEDNRVLAVASERRRRQAQHVLGLGPLEDGLERDGRQVMALVDDDVAVLFDQLADLALAGQRLHHGNVDPAGGPGLAAADGTDHFLADLEERMQALLPLPQQLGAMDQDQGVHATARDQCRCRYRLAERSRCAQYADVVTEHRLGGSLLVEPERSCEAHIKMLTFISLVAQVQRDACCPATVPARHPSSRAAGRYAWGSSRRSR